LRLLVLNAGLSIRPPAYATPWRIESVLVLPLPVSLPPKLRVTTADTEHVPFHLRTFFRVLSSWAHHLKPTSTGLLVVLDSRPEPSGPYGSRRGHKLVQRHS
jgi:hypothetical protein